ncbi:MAG: sulfotransferase [Actinomycetota bacterium]
MGVYVVGMHRSGTSAVAGLLSALGQLPAGRLAVPSNPDGQWERPELRPALELLLAANRATWAHPPPDGHTLRVPAPLSAYTARVFRRHAADPFLWKDPRLCLTIDHWLGLAKGPAKVVVIHRRPTEVADSLAARNGWSPEQGLALWERTNRNAITRLAGREVFVVDHGSLLANPAEMAAALGGWLGLHEAADQARAAATITGPTGRSARSDGTRISELTDAQQALADRLARSSGPTRLDLVDVGPESATTGPVLGSPSSIELGRRAARAVWAMPRRHTVEIAGSPADPTA